MPDRRQDFAVASRDLFHNSPVNAGTDIYCSPYTRWEDTKTSLRSDPQHIKRTIAEQAVEIIPVRPFVAGKILAFFM